MPAIELEEKRTDSNELDPNAKIESQGEDEGREKEEPKTKTPETDEMRKAIADLATTVKGIAAPKEERKELTQEEKNELWAVYDPEKGRPDFMKKFFKLNPEATQEEIDEAKAMWKDMQTGIVKQAVRGAQNFMAAMKEELMESMKEALDFVSEAKAEKMRTNFFKVYPVLEDPKYAKIVDAQAKILAKQEFASQDDYFKALAEGAADAIKPFVADFDLGKKPEKKPAATTQRLPRTSAGSTSGAGGGVKEPVRTSRSDSDSLYN